jgi:hypothetical protein
MPLSFNKLGLMQCSEFNQTPAVFVGPGFQPAAGLPPGVLCFDDA